MPEHDKSKTTVVEVRDLSQPEHGKSGKLSVVATAQDLAGVWEYRCARCTQLRLYPGKDPPTKCGACGGTDLIVGRPGTLPT